MVNSIIQHLCFRASQNSFRLLIICLFAIQCSMMSSAASEEVNSPGEPNLIPIKSVLEIVKQNEHRVEAVLFRASSNFAFFVMTDSGWSVQEPNGEGGTNKTDEEGELISVTSTITFEPHTERYHAEVAKRQTAMLIPPGESTSPRLHYMEISDQYASDRVAFNKLGGGFVTTTNPDWKVPAEKWDDVRPYPPRGFVYHDRDSGKQFSNNKDFIAENGFLTGIGWVTPFIATEFERPQKLSSLIENKLNSKDHLCARILQDGTWEIFYSTVDTYKYPYMFCISYDPQVGRVIKCEWGGCKACKVLDFKDWFPNQIAQFTYSTADALIPDQVALVRYGEDRAEAFPVGTERKGQFWQYHNAVLNPPLKNDSFTIAFEKGVDVVDYIGERRYVVGGGLEKDRVSVQNFIDFHGLLKEEHLESDSRNGSMVWIIVTCNALVVFVVLLLMFLKKRPGLVGKGSNNSLVLLLCTCAFCYSTAKIEGDDDPKTEVLRHCGQLVTMATLYCYGIEYDLEVIRSALRPESRGVPLSRIKIVLEGYGLQTNARRGVTLDDFLTTITPEVSAIVPVPIELNMNHYVLMMRKDTSSPVLVVDLPDIATPLTDVFREPLNRMGGAALFVTRSARSRSDIAVVEIFPKTVEMGDINVSATGDENSETVNFKVTNRENYPVIVKAVVGCGCINISETAPTILDARGEWLFDAVIHKRAWGLGAQKKLVAIETSAGRMAAAEISGTGTTLFINKEIRIEPEKLSINIPVRSWCSADQNTGITCEQIHIQASPIQLTGLDVSCADPWLSLIVHEAGADAVYVTPTVALTSAVRELLKESDSVISTGIKIRLANKSVEVPMRITRESCLAFTPAHLRIGADKEYVDMVLRPRFADDILLKKDCEVKLSLALSGKPLQCISDVVSDGIAIRVPCGQIRSERPIVIRATVETSVGVEKASSVLSFRHERQ